MPPQDLLASFDAAVLARNGVPDAVTMAGRRDCHRLVTDALGPELAALHHSPLGVEWTEVFDAYLRSPVAEADLRRWGWLPLDRIAGTARRRSRAAATVWGVVDSGRLVGAVRLHPRPGPHDPVQRVIASARARGEVRLRDVLELADLRRGGHPFPSSAGVLATAADIESGLGGRSLAAWATGRALPAPAAVAHARPSRRLVVAITGVDGSGKSTLRTALCAGLDRCGIPVDTVWVRPGMGLGAMVSLAGRVKRLLGQDATPGFRVMAAGEDAVLRSRSGAVGWIWAMVVTISFLTGVWRQHRAARGVVVYDRHLVDALATLDVIYAGVDLRLAHRLVRTLLPRAAISVYLDVPTEVSVARKPDDVVGATAVRRQLAAYERWLAVSPATLRLDATRAPQDLLAEVLRLLTRG